MTDTSKLAEAIRWMMIDLHSMNRNRFEKMGLIKSNMEDNAKWAEFKANPILFVLKLNSGELWTLVKELEPCFSHVAEPTCKPNTFTSFAEGRGDGIRQMNTEADRPSFASSANDDHLKPLHQTNIHIEELVMMAALQPKIFVDGNRWCVLYGENLQDGVAGFGDSPILAIRDFGFAWNKKLPKKVSPEPTCSVPPVASVWVHTASNKSYTIVTDCFFEATHEHGVVYKETGVNGGPVWVRLLKDFMDGRFKRL